MSLAEKPLVADAHFEESPIISVFGVRGRIPLTRSLHVQKSHQTPYTMRETVCGYRAVAGVAEPPTREAQNLKEVAREIICHVDVVTAVFVIKTSPAALIEVSVCQLKHKMKL